MRKSPWHLAPVALLAGCWSIGSWNDTDGANVAPVIATFTATPSSLVYGRTTSVTWSWAYTAAPSPAPTCRVDGGVGTVTSGGSTMVTLAVGTTFTLTCTNAAGSDTAQATVVVTPVDVAPVIATFTAAPSSLVNGTPTSVTWSWTYTGVPSPAPTCQVDGGVGPVTSGGSTSVTLSADTIFKLTCTNAAGSGTKQATVVVTPVPVAPAIASFTATPSSLVSGTPTSVIWSWTYGGVPSPAPACQVDGGVGTVTSGGSTSVTLSADTTFTLTCTNAAGSDTAQATVVVTPAPVAPLIATFSVTPSQVTNGVPTALTWTWTYSNTPSPAPACQVQGIGTVTNGSSTTLTLLSTVTFSLTCTNGSGSSSAQAIVEVDEPPTLVSFSANPSTVTQGDPTAVTWTWSYQATPSPLPTCQIDQGVGTVTSGDAASVTLAADTTFTLTCSNRAGTTSRQTTIVAVPPVAPVLATFTVAPQPVPADVPTVVTWSWTFSNAPSPTPTCSVSPAIGAVTNGRMLPVSIATDTTFTLTCVNAGGSDTAQAVVTTRAPWVVAGASGGYLHTCARIPGDALRCWGAGGRLGDGTLTTSLVPAEVPSLTSGVAAVAAGFGHSCASPSDGTVQCWGLNDAGQLGDGSTTRRLAPVTVSGIATASGVVAAGYRHSCAALSAGGLQCWGDNSDQQLGDGSRNDSYTPVTVQGITVPVLAIATGWYHTCALLEGGSVWCWGLNRFGQLGNGTTTDSSVPVASAITSGATALTAANESTCAVVGGGAKCWGYNSGAQLGDGSTTVRLSPVDVSGLTSGVVDIRLGFTHACALLTGGAVNCWGWNSVGQIGIGTPLDATTPTHRTPSAVTGAAAGAVGIAVGDFHSCAWFSGGGMQCWGSSDFGQVGDGTTTDRSVPTWVSGL